MAGKGYRRTITLDFDYTQIKNGVPAINQQMRLLDSEFKKSTEEVKAYGKSSEQVFLKQEQLTAKVALQAKKVDELSKAYKESSDEMGENDKRTVKLKTEYNNAEAALLKLKGELKDTNEEIKKQEGFFGGLVAKIDDFKESAAKAGIDVDKMADGFIKVGGVLTGVGVAAGTMAMSFEKEMTKVLIQADTSVASFDDLKNIVLDVSDSYGIAANEVAKTAEDLLSSNIATKDLNITLTNTARLAKASGTEIGSAGDVVSTFMNAFGLAVEDQAGMVDKLVMAQFKGKVSIQELGNAAGDVASTLKMTGVSYEEYLAVLSAMTVQGKSTSASSHALNAAISNIINPSKEASQAAAELGINFSAAGLKAKGLDGFLDGVKRATGGNVESLARLFGSTTALTEVMALAGTQTDYFKESLDDIKNSSGTAQANIDILNEAAGEKLSKSFEQLRNQLIRAGEAFLPIIEGISGFIGWVAQAPPGVITFVSVLGGVLLVIGNMVKGLGTLSAISTATAAKQLAVAAANGAIAVSGTAATATNATLSVSNSVVATTSAAAAAGLMSMAAPIILITAIVLALVAALALVVHGVNQVNKAKLAPQVDTSGINQQAYSSARASASNIPAYASGTTHHRGGRALVGDNGPEIIDLPSGSKVYNARRTQNMLDQEPTQVVENNYYYPIIDMSKIKSFEQMEEFFKSWKQTKRSMG